MQTDVEIPISSKPRKTTSKIQYAIWWKSVSGSCGPSTAGVVCTVEEENSIYAQLRSMTTFIMATTMSSLSLAVNDMPDGVTSTAY